MKADKLLDELIQLAATMGYTVRRETGAFKGGACVIHESRMILINRSMPAEASCVVLARALARMGASDMYVKPAVRDILERERIWVEQHPEVTFGAA